MVLNVFSIFFGVTIQDFLVFFFGLVYVKGGSHDPILARGTLSFDDLGLPMLSQESKMVDPASHKMCSYKIKKGHIIRDVLLQNQSLS